MIVTVTCNPAIDSTINGEQIVNNIGGKGINVSKVLKSLNCECFCTGLLGKENGKFICDGLDELGISHHFIEVEGKVRTNTKRIIDKKLFEENEKGPEVASEKLEELKDYLKQFHDDIIVISGSAPANCDPHFYAELVKNAKQNHNYVILDCDKQMLKNALKQRPDAIKPNEDEILRLLEIDDKKKIIDEALKLDIDLLVVSLGSDGALFFKDGAVYRCQCPEVDYVSAVGAGDSMVAAMAYAKKNDYSFEEMIRLAMACASASVEMSGSNPPEKERINKFLDKVVIEKVR